MQLSSFYRLDAHLVAHVEETSLSSFEFCDMARPPAGRTVRGRVVILRWTRSERKLRHPEAMPTASKATRSD